MYRPDKDRAHQLRAHKRYVNLRSSGWGSFMGPGAWATQAGRFRKGSGLGCRAGRKCWLCHGWVKEPTRQERRSDIDFEEWKEDYMSVF